MKKLPKFGESIRMPQQTTAVLGIDPGSESGYYCINRFFEFKGKTTRDTVVCPLPALSEFRQVLFQLRKVYTRQNLLVVMENPVGVAFMHTRGRKVGMGSTIKFMRHVGMLEGLILGMGLKYHLVTPQNWQKHLKCLTKGDKRISQAAAIQRYPGLHITQKSADAVLISHYGCLYYLGN